MSFGRELVSMTVLAFGVYLLAKGYLPEFVQYATKSGPPMQAASNVPSQATTTAAINNNPTAVKQFDSSSVIGGLAALNNNGGIL